MDDTIEIGTTEAVPHCSKCRSDNLPMPEGITSQDDLTDDSLITCVTCQELGAQGRDQDC